MKKIIKIVFVFMVLIVSISSISLMADVFDNGETNRKPNSSSNNSSGAINTETVLINNNDTAFSAISNNENGAYFIDGKYLVYSGELDSNGTEYISVPIASEKKGYIDGIAISDFKKIVIEFDLINEYEYSSENSNENIYCKPLGADIAIFGTTVDGASYHLYNFGIDVISEGSTGEVGIQCGGLLLSGSRLRVRLEIENVEGEFDFETKEYVMKEDKFELVVTGQSKNLYEIVNVTEIRFNNLQHTESPLALGFDNLIVKGYK